MTTNSSWHIGPAGSHYASIHQAGNALLQTSAPAYLTDSGCHLLPPMLKNSYVEAVDDAGVVPKSRNADPNKHKGMLLNKAGEESEIKVFQAIDKFISENHNGHTLLVFHSFRYNNFKVDTIASAYPSVASAMLQFKLRHTSGRMVGRVNGESDFMLVVKDVGVIHMEVKHDNSPGSLSKATQQLGMCYIL